MRAKSLYPVWRLALLIVPLFAAASCVKDDAAPGGDTFVTVTIKAPGATGQQTRGLDATQQNHVQEIDILAFHPSTGRFEYAARCSGAAITGASATKTFTITLREGTYDLMILANAQDIVAGLPLWGSNKTAVTAALGVGVPPGGKWPADGTAHLPGWGEVKNQTIAQGTAIGSGANPVPMTRMHAAVDIVLSAAAQADFELTSVRLYNYNTRGMLIPDTGNPLAWDTPSWTALIPTPVSTTPVKGPVLYDNSAATADKTKYAGEIFLFEAANGGAADYPDIVCLVVGGIYLPTGDPAYYRVDFSAKDAMGNVSYIDILRNHKYTISVTGVTGKGLPDPDEAYNSVPADIEVKITDWNLGENVVLDPDGQRYLWLSDLEFEAEPDGETFTMTIDTDATSWKAVVSDSDVNPNAGGASWLTVSPATGGAGTHTLTITAPDNDELADRDGYIHILADDRLDAVIKVVQDFELDLEQIPNHPIPYGYVAAFWRNDQTGERLIKLINNGGAWTATVVAGTDWIVLDREESLDPNIGTSLAADMIQDDALYQVNSILTSVTGNAAEEGQASINFRIGLRSTYTPTAEAPARYGLVLVRYNDNTENHLIFVRQGEQADYVMRPEDNNEAGTITTEWGGTADLPRPAARKWAPYNLTAAEYNAGTSATSINLYSGMNHIYGVFTNYPTQAGAHFQWMPVWPKAYHPTLAVALSTELYLDTDFWATYSSGIERCPTGYRRPKDGSTTAYNTTGAIIDSEFRQSLFLNPVTGFTTTTTSTLGNVVTYAYCADGYYDRVSANPIVTFVNPGTSKVGFLGVVYYNPKTYAHIYLPNAGYRSSSTVMAAQIEGRYWSTASYNANYRVILNSISTSTSAGMSRDYYFGAASVRCVLDE